MPIRDDGVMPQGDEARRRVADLLDAFKHDQEPRWNAERRHCFADGTSLQLQLEREPRAFHSAPGHTRAVLFDKEGNELDATEWFADPAERVIGTVTRLRVLVDKYLAK